MNNLSPFFSHSLSDVYDQTSNPSGYWRQLTNRFTSLGNGWARVDFNNTSTSATQYAYFIPRVRPWVKPSTRYTLMVEWRNNTIQTNNSVAFGMNTAVTTQIPLAVLNYFNTGSGVKYLRCSSRDDPFSSDRTALCGTYFLARPSTTGSVDVRISLYEGDYTGAYEPYLAYSGGTPKTPRFLVYSHEDFVEFELSPNELHSATMVEEINGEHSLTITTTQTLEKQQRVVMIDEMGKVREWVVTGLTEAHDDMVVPLNTYYCVWSLQHDLSCTIVNSIIASPVSSTVALQAALEGTGRWELGTITQNTQGSGSMYYKSGWEALGVVVQFWGGEIDAQIELDRLSNKIISRKVCLYNQLGSKTAARRFDYSYDLKSIKRKVADYPFTCRITPRGRGEETENGGYGRRITIADVNGGIEWIEDPESVPLSRVPLPDGTYEYPNQIVIFEDIDDPQQLLDHAREHITEYSRPRVTYEADVLQLEEAGLDAHGLALGDVVQCVDNGFEGGLRIEGRVRKLVTDLLGDNSSI